MSYRLALAAVLLALVPGSPAIAGTPAQRCEGAAAAGLATCVQKVGLRMRSCYLVTGAPCPGGDAETTTALTKLAQKVLGKCADAAVQAGGYGPVATGAALGD